MRFRDLAGLSVLLLAFPGGCLHRPETSPLAGDGTADRLLEELKEGQTVEGFRTVAVYTDANERALGARFTHVATGLDFTLLRIQSVPQAFLWVRSFPTSDMGEPHTQEHLLLGKGNKGRYVASLDEMSLAGSSAYTEQTRTCYHFHTTAGAATFWLLLEKRMDALLHPDYDDEEVRREVRHVGITETAGTGELRLEEQGTVYNEMVSSFERPWSRMLQQLQLSVYGPDHPLSFVSGGLPAAIRDMRPEDIRRFHLENYHLANMGIIVALPGDMPIRESLSRSSEILGRLVAGETGSRRARTEADLPPPSPAPAGRVQRVPYPHQNAEDPGDVVLVWPAALDLGTRERLLLELFVDAFAGDDTTRLYRVLVDSKTREVDLGATGIFAGVSEDLGHPVWIALSGVAAAHLDDETLRDIRRRVLEELSGLAELPDGSVELEQFNAAVRGRVIEQRRNLSKLVGSPPGFGFRGTGSFWMNHLERLARSPGFRRSLVMREDLDHVLELLDGGRNIWREGIERWKLLGSAPHVLAAVADPQLAESERLEREGRLAAELERLEQLYGTTDSAEALRRFRVDDGITTSRLDSLAAQVATPAFIDDPPLTLDDRLDYEVTDAGGSVPLVFSRFDSMTGGTVGLALRLDGLDEQQLLYLATLPALLTEVGVLRDGRPLDHVAMRERLRREILDLTAYTTTNFRSGRAELVVRAAGNDLEETRQAVGWIRAVLTGPDWRPENLPRLRDLLDRSINELRNTMREPEEAWVDDPAAAYLRQDDRLLLSTESFLTREHNAHRLRWMLEELADPEDRRSVSAYLERLAGAAQEAARADLATLCAILQGKPEGEGGLPDQLSALTRTDELSAAARKVVGAAAEDLEQILPDLPDSSLARDWAYLCRQIRQDLLRPPAEVLGDLAGLRRSLLRTENARLFVVAGTTTMDALGDELRSLVAQLDPAPVRRREHRASRLVDARLAEREPGAGDPVFVGLVNPNTQGGVFLNSAPGVSYADTDRESVLRYLASNLYGGGGAHSIFMKTWGAGLAYSNGLGNNPASGRKSYYAERCPELPQTLRFVIGELRRATVDPALGDYAVSQAFGASRAASSYEARGESMAEDLTDGITPEVVGQLRRAVLEIRRTPRLADELFARMESVYGELLPGYGPPTVAEGVYFVIGPERQMELYEEYLRSVVGPEARLHRIFPRDYWMTGTW